ncbi:LuxR C-terminal-related transcriptional regulator [Streptomyces sp. NPDC005574]|uniref:helix-turn-helix transcriptional regulator n=1 Tax=Streptomyces sp. NPDC005574 TaxID=3156891 RepID=UPI0033BD8D08
MAAHRTEPPTTSRTSRDDTPRRAVTALLDRMGTGSAVLVLTGEPGLGRTTLLDETARRCTAGPVLRTRCERPGPGRPYDGTRALARAVAALTADPPADPPEPGAGADALLAALRTAAAEAPLLVCVDDAHRWDPASRAVLRHVADRLHTAGRVGLIVSVARHGPPDAEFAGLPAAELEPLDPSRAAALLDEATDDTIAPGVRDALVEEAEGNPALLRALVRRLSSAQLRGGRALPSPTADADTLATVLGEPLAVLAPAQDDVRLTAAAALRATEDTDIDAELVLRAVGLTTPGAAPEITGPGSLFPGLSLDGGRLRFTSRLLRRAAYTGAAADRRRRAHRALAHLLGARGERLPALLHRAWSLPGPAAGPAAELASAAADDTAAAPHRLRSAAYARAAELTADGAARAGRYTAAAEQALLAGCPHRALRLLAQARTCAAPAAVHGRAELLRGRAELRDGPVADAHASLLLAAHLLDTDPGTHAQAALARLAAGDAAWWAGDREACLTALSEGGAPGPGEANGTATLADAGARPMARPAGTVPVADAWDGVSGTFPAEAGVVGGDVGGGAASVGRTDGVVPVADASGGVPGTFPAGVAGGDVGGSSASVGRPGGTGPVADALGGVSGTFPAEAGVVGGGVGGSSASVGRPGGVVPVADASGGVPGTFPAGVGVAGGDVGGSSASVGRPGGVVPVADALGGVPGTLPVGAAVMGADAGRSAASAGPGVVRDYRLGMRAVLEGRLDRAAGPLGRVVSRAAGEDDPERLLRSASAALVLGRIGAARRAGAHALAAARAKGSAVLVPQALEYLAYAELRAGRHAQARTHAEEGLRAAYATGQRNTAAHHHAVLALAASIEGRTDVVAEQVRAALATARRHGLAQAATLAMWAAARSDLGRGRPVDAADRLGPEVRPGPGRGHFAVWMLAAPCFVEAAVLSGRPGDALAVVADLAVWAEFGADPQAPAQLARCAALLAEPERAQALYARALALHEAAGGDFERARTALLYGRWLRRRRRLREARDHLGAALVGFERCGAAVWAEQARGELRANGTAPLVTDAGSLRRLTPQQQRIARYVAQGATNREVALSLAVSTRTVDYHLRNIFAVLGVRSRMELARMVEQAEKTAAQP